MSMARCGSVCLQHLRPHLNINAPDVSTRKKQHNVGNKQPRVAMMSGSILRLTSSERGNLAAATAIAAPKAPSEQAGHVTAKASIPEEPVKVKEEAVAASPTASRGCRHAWALGGGGAQVALAQDFLQAQWRTAAAAAEHARRQGNCAALRRVRSIWVLG